MRFIALFSLCTLTATPAVAYQLNVNAKAAYLYHPATETTLYTHNAQEQMQPASLTKLMTLYLLFEHLEKGEITLDSQFPISEKAWRKGGSKMFLEVGKTARVEDLIRGIAISSGNDATIVVAEYLGGTEDGFTAMMNAKAEKLGMANTNFMNASGWPNDLQLTTAEDMSKLATHIVKDFPEYYPYFSENVFTYSGIKQMNRNGLLRQNVGVDGMKTGHIEEAGYHLIASSKQGGERLIAVVMGTDGFAAREGESLKLLRYGFTQHKNKQIWGKHQTIAQAPVWLGNVANIPLLTEEAAIAFMKKNKATPKNVHVSYTEPLMAPITAGDVIGQVTTEVDGRVYSSQLIAGADVAKAGFLPAFMQKLFYRFGL